MKKTVEDIIGNYTDSIPLELIEAIKNNSCIALIGSGISSRCLAKNRKPLPLWHTLLINIIDYSLKNKLIDENLYTELKMLLEKNNYLDVAQELYEVLGDKEIQNLIENIFNPEGIIPSRLHEIISLTPFKHILTTNYDNLLERAYIETNKHHIDVVLFKDILEYDNLGDVKCIIKLHGDIKQPESFVLGQQHYQNLLRDKKYCDFVDNMFQNNSIFMLGYGLRDIDITMTLDRISACNNKLHFLLTKKNTYTNIEKKRLLKDRNVKVIEYIDYFGFHNHIDTFLMGLNLSVNNYENLTKLSRQEIRARIAVHYPKETKENGQFIHNFVFREGAITLADKSFEAQLKHLDQFLENEFNPLDYLLFVIKDEHLKKENKFFDKIKLSINKCLESNVHLIFIIVGCNKRPEFILNNVLSPVFYLENDFSEKDLMVLRSYLLQEIQMGFRQA